MTAIVFTGPTLSPEEVKRECDALCLPPVAQGDVYRATQRRPSAIGIIDGYFNGAPSVWHKEILYALSQSIPVFGSASMGALRAAELHGFGMRGVGRIFEAYRDGRLEDDDEVAVIHGPSELGFLPLSEAMVNIRATLAKAVADKVISAASRAALEGGAKALFFHRRDWAMILEVGLVKGVAAPEITALRSWLPERKIDQKREDAVAMLAAMRERAEASSYPDQVFRFENFRFEWTHFWDEMVAREAAGAGLVEDDAALPPDLILDELRISSTEAYWAAKAWAVVGLGAEARSEHQTQAPGAEALRAELARLQTELRLFVRADLGAWLSRNDLDEASLERLLRGRIRYAATMEARGPRVDLAMLDQLRLDGAYEGLVARARAKRAVLDNGLKSVGPPSNGEALAARLQFLQSRCHGWPDMDIQSMARELGFRNLEHLDKALRDEQYYTRIANSDAC